MPDQASLQPAPPFGVVLVDTVPLVCLASMLAVSVSVGHAFGFAYSGASISLVFALSVMLWLLAKMTQRISPKATRAAYIAEGTGLLFALSLMASITSAVLAASNSALIDFQLSNADRILLPWLPWQNMIAGLKQHPWVLRIMSYVYVSLNWQPFLLLALVFATHRDDILRKFIASWAISLTVTTIPFFWLPALGPYQYYHIYNGPEFGLLVDISFKFPQILGEIRNSSSPVIDKSTITGLVSMPSFHACSATLFAWYFRYWRPLRGPMTLLNASMIISAVPIGGHYYVDVVAGCIVAAIAIGFVNFLSNLDLRNPQKHFRFSVSAHTERANS